MIAVITATKVFGRTRDAAQLFASTKTKPARDLGVASERGTSYE